MIPDAEKISGAVWSTKNDPRITKIGHILRKFSLDELPQIYSVLKDFFTTAKHSKNSYTLKILNLYFSKDYNPIY